MSENNPEPPVKKNQNVDKLSRRYDWSKWFKEFHPTSVILKPTDNIPQLRQGESDVVRLGICEFHADGLMYFSDSFEKLLSVAMEKHNDNVPAAVTDAVWQWSMVTMKPVGFDNPHAKYPFIPVEQVGWRPEDLKPTIEYVKFVVRNVFKR